MPRRLSVLESIAREVRDAKRLTQAAHELASIAFSSSILDLPAVQLRVERRALTRIRSIADGSSLESGNLVEDDD